MLGAFLSLAALAHSFALKTAGEWRLYWEIVGVYDKQMVVGELLEPGKSGIYRMVNVEKRPDVE